MGREAIKISKLDVKGLIDTLNAALAEEWLAYYQYWIGARVMEGPMRSEVEPELLVHANEELSHAEQLVARIIQLGGEPVLDPADWSKFAKCPYAAPEDHYIETILDQNLKGERCAIERYQGIAEQTLGKDYATYQMAIGILADEIEHEDDLEAWIRDLERMKSDFLKLRR